MAQTNDRIIFAIVKVLMYQGQGGVLTWQEYVMYAEKEKCPETL